MEHSAVVLVAHGTRDPRGADTVRRLAERVAQALPAREVRLAYVDVQEPLVGEALDDVMTRHDSVVVVPLLLAGLALSLPLPDWNVPWPAPPSFPRPDWSIRWPDLPPVPVPDWTLPEWLVWALEHVHFVSPVVIGYLLARREVRRRRTQDERRATRAAGSRHPDA